MHSLAHAMSIKVMNIILNLTGVRVGGVERKGSSVKGNRTGVKWKVVGRIYGLV
jgi:hypothetical protein